MMDTNLLRSWLGLPPGPWPPDDLTLLGLTDRVDPATAERRALELMGKLRPHQLVHPELVTEGMNRLAQALLAVTMGGPTVPRPAPPPVAPEPRPNPAPPKAVEVVPIAPAEPTVAEPLPARPVAPVEPHPLVGVPEPAEVPAPVVGSRRADRRRAYRELVGLRGLLRAWDRLGSTVADPSEQLLTPGRVFDYLDGVAAVRSAADHPGLDDLPLGELAPVLARVLLYPLPLAIFRDLVPQQRLAVARDWAMTRAGLEARIDALRVSLRRSAPKPGFDRMLAHSVAYLGRNPEWLLVTATVVLFVVAGARAALR